MRACHTRTSRAASVSTTWPFSPGLISGRAQRQTTYGYTYYSSGMLSSMTVSQALPGDTAITTYNYDSLGNLRELCLPRRQATMRLPGLESHRAGVVRRSRADFGSGTRHGPGRGPRFSRGSAPTAALRALMPQRVGGFHVRARVDAHSHDSFRHTGVPASISGRRLKSGEPCERSSESFRC